MYKAGYVTLEEGARIFSEHKDAQDEMKSEQRSRAAASYE